MKEADRDLVRDLLAVRSVMALSVLVEGRPFVSQLPFAASSDFGSLFVHASQMARHSQGLLEGALFSGLVQAAADEDADPFQIPRLMISGTVRPLERGSEAYLAGRDCFLAKLPTGRITFSLGDFVLYELVVEKARLVAGFGRTANLTRGLLAQAADGSQQIALHAVRDPGADT